MKEFIAFVALGACAAPSFANDSSVLIVGKDKPCKLVSLCMDAVKKIGSTRFEVRKSNFDPTRDIQIPFAEFCDPNAL
ncbi:MAG: DUF4424 family protein [Sphingobium sp.]|nr:MAG: DUF4424 family protein [Sphingobium sp.]